MAFRPPKASSPSVVVIYGRASGLSNTFSKNIHIDCGKSRPVENLYRRGAAHRTRMPYKRHGLLGFLASLRSPAQPRLTRGLRRLVSHPSAEPAMRSADSTSLQAEQREIGRPNRDSDAPARPIACFPRPGARTAH
jgi:hypothetical protein